MGVAPRHHRRAFGDAEVGLPQRHPVLVGRFSNEQFRNARLPNEKRGNGRSPGYCGRPVGIPLVATNVADLNENDRAGGGNCRKDVFAEAIMPEFVLGQT